MPRLLTRTSRAGSRLALSFWLLLALAVGAFLRLDQVVAQVLVGDEWHPVHQLTYYSPRHIISSFGNADYSIPLVLFYWLQMKWHGVSELTLRLPMIVAGVLTLIALPMGLPKWFVGRTTHSVDATRLMWAFFRDHPLPRNNRAAGPLSP